MTHVVAAATLVAACAASPDELVGERVLPDTRVVAEHFERAVAMQGPYAFQMPAQLQAAWAAPTPAVEPAKPSLWARLWPAASSTPAAPRPASRPLSLWDHFWPPLAPATAATRTAPPAVATAAPRRSVAQARQPLPAVAAASARAAPRPTESKGSGLSELRLGALKHAVSPGHRAKEHGMDGNVEALFHSPDWLAWAWSPRPHLGIVANGSKRATDFLYGGLTWEWMFWDALFVDLGLGLSVHDGMIDNSKITGKDRRDRREFGCRPLFRESLEFGYRFLERHSVSLMWEHHSHGSLCSEENEGIDNAGIRYGYRM